ncbi:uncharacterized protein LOC133634268 [Entelurus aequoreus]|uniref:uncharacterized protein LOC133634268 n=1 Tax=Entelurus aequoreus TaxID=161455 RepID=UPI002B1D1064|nr:uncharacterized protein LOC133634268 [Entelurus aequoreus]
MASSLGGGGGASSRFRRRPSCSSYPHHPCSPSDLSAKHLPITPAALRADSAKLPPANHGVFNRKCEPDSCDSATLLQLLPASCQQRAPSRCSGPANYCPGAARTCSDNRRLPEGSTSTHPGDGRASRGQAPGSLCAVFPLMDLTNRNGARSEKEMRASGSMPMTSVLFDQPFYCQQRLTTVKFHRFLSKFTKTSPWSYRVCLADWRASFRS